MLKEPSPSMGEGWAGVRAPSSRQEAQLARRLSRQLLKHRAHTPIPDPSPIEGEGRLEGRPR